MSDRIFFRTISFLLSQTWCLCSVKHQPSSSSSLSPSLKCVFPLHEKPTYRTPLFIVAFLPVRRSMQRWTTIPNKQAMWSPSRLERRLRISTWLLTRGVVMFGCRQPMQIYALTSLWRLCTILLVTLHVRTGISIMSCYISRPMGHNERPERQRE